MPSSIRPGDVLAGRYRLVDLLAESRGGRFWRAHDRVLERHVALHCLAFTTVGVTLAPVAIHRHVFQEDAKTELVQAGHRLTATALVLIGLMLGGILFLVVDVVYDRWAAAAAGVAAVAVLAVLLLVLPTRVSMGSDDD